MFHADRGPTAGALIELAGDVETRFSAWVVRHGYMNDEPDERTNDGWWLSAAREPSGLLREVNRRAGTRFDVNAAVRVAAGDRKGRERLVRYVARPLSPKIKARFGTRSVYGGPSGARREAASAIW